MGGQALESKSEDEAPIIPYFYRISTGGREYNGNPVNSQGMYRVTGNHPPLSAKCRSPDIRHHPLATPLMQAPAFSFTARASALQLTALHLCLLLLNFSPLYASSHRTTNFPCSHPQHSREFRSGASIFERIYNLLNLWHEISRCWPSQQKVRYPSMS
ncbi:hypothetical protein Hypma_000382 [Hypsizygus marmoreus]|uniref:Uncharacterized protein n=1 Tax=Hypsizygus marmoreus TaxID=39966 RepID=A0A369J8L7_HYPMA|nr:hypothetical protein Hypma_000382 [Hypsizygus marmoreus]